MYRSNYTHEEAMSLKKFTGIVGLLIGASLSSPLGLLTLDQIKKKEIVEEKLQHQVEVNQYLRVKDNPHLDRFITQYYQEHPEIR